MKYQVSLNKSNLLNSQRINFLLNSWLTGQRRKTCPIVVYPGSGQIINVYLWLDLYKLYTIYWSLVFVYALDYNFIHLYYSNYLKLIFVFYCKKIKLL